MAATIVKRISYIVLLLALFEGALRLQQRIGPFLDLEMKESDTRYLSDVVNHRPREGRNYRTIIGTEAEMYFSKDGIRINKARPSDIDKEEAFTILFMGDSFVQGYGDDDTIPQHIWEYFERSGKDTRGLALLNAGYLSYSPLIYSAQARMLQSHIKPDLVVLVLDETDMSDDYCRYRHLAVRDGNGNVIAVKATPPLKHFFEGLAAIKKHPLYLVRCAAKVVHTRILAPIRYRAYRERILKEIAPLSRAGERRRFERSAEEIAFFKENVRELITALERMTGSKRKILLVCHPQPEFIIPDEKGRVAKPFVADTAAGVAEDLNVAFYDATEDLLEAFGPDPQKYYLRGDIHFTAEGMRIYSELIAVKISEMIDGDATPGL
jgi:lysophospholipase L1-like esterase